MPSSALDPLLRQAQTHFLAGQFARAEALLAQVLAIDARNASALHLMGQSAYARHDHERAVELIRAAIRQRATVPQYHSNLGLALQALGRLDAALAAFGRALKLDPGSAVFLANQANALKDAGEIERALGGFERVLALDPASAAARFGRALCHLALGNFAAAWADYRWRLDCAPCAEASELACGLRAARGRELPERLAAGVRLLVLHEQGPGDELFFLRYAPRLRARGVRIACVASARTAPLLAAAPWLDSVHAPGEPLPPYDHALLAGDLPGIEGSTDAPPPAPLVVPADRLAATHARLARAAAPPYLGITWRGGGEARIGAAPPLRKRVPLDDLARAVRGWRGGIVVLQRAPEAGEIERFGALCGRPVVDCSDANDDLVAMAGMLARIEQYVGVSNTNMHLRAALGGQARVLIPRPGEWRWPAAMTHSPWFPDWPLYREERGAGWRPALARLAADLAAAASPVSE